MDHIHYWLFANSYPLVCLVGPSLEDAREVRTGDVHRYTCKTDDCGAQLVVQAKWGEAEHRFVI